MSRAAAGSPRCLKPAYIRYKTASQADLEAGRAYQDPLNSTRMAVGGRKRALGTRAPMAVPQGPNRRWSLDFVSDALADRRRFRILAVVDDFSRECLCLAADTSLTGQRVARDG